MALTVHALGCRSKGENVESETVHILSNEPFEPRTAIVTASDSGIGRATAVALALAGMDVGVTWHTDEEGAEETAREVRSHGRRAVVAHLDTTDLPGCGDVIDALAEALGGLDRVRQQRGHRRWCAAARAHP